MDKLAILGGTPVREAPYPSWPVYDDRDIQAVAEVIRSGNWGGYPYPGPQSAQLALRFAEMQGGGHAVLMANGTVTMEVALRAMNIGWGDEVIIPAYTFQATASAVMQAGAIPVIVDVSFDTYCIDPKAVEAAVTPKTKAVIPVHLGAQMADMDAIMKIAHHHNLVVVEDCAHAHGARWGGSGGGTLGQFGSFSLQSSKTVTTGEGGVLLCQTPELAARVANIIDCGRPHDENGSLFTMGTNYRMTEIQAALGLIALQRFPQQAKQREAMAAYMEEALGEVPGVRLLKRQPRHTRRSFYRYIFAINPQILGAKHDVVCLALEKEGIPCDVGYEPMHHYSLFQPMLSRLAVPLAFPEYFNFTKMHFPVAEQAGEAEAVWLDESIFRSDQKGIDDVILALKKLMVHTDQLAKLSLEIRE
jgi:L-glutamine:2-deoxy-scyllo-inosose/3-amino-2,3-dideoxy-scyllo-inosose aminotransferase